MSIYSIKQFAYHGTTSNYLESLKRGINFNLCDERTDFGKGFYLANSFIQARKWSCYLARRHNISEITKTKYNIGYKPEYVQPLIIEYKLNVRLIQTLNGYTFEEANDNWRRFVYNNRNEGNLYCDAQHNRDSKYDFVHGFLADGIMDDIKLVNSGLMSIEDFLKTIRPIGNQVSVHTIRALECISCEGVILYEKS